MKNPLSYISTFFLIQDTSSDRQTCLVYVPGGRWQRIEIWQSSEYVVWNSLAWRVAKCRKERRRRIRLF